jgi:transposase InsO family protein
MSESEKKKGGKKSKKEENPAEEEITSTVETLTKQKKSSKKSGKATDDVHNTSDDYKALDKSLEDSELDLEARFSDSNSVSSILTPQYEGDSDEESPEEREDRLDRKRRFKEEATKLNLPPIEHGIYVSKKMKTSHPYVYSKDREIAQLQEQLKRITQGNQQQRLTVLSEGELPSKNMTAPLTLEKARAYCNQVKALQNSNAEFTENRNTFDDRVEALIEMWWVTSPQGREKPGEWKRLSFETFEQFLMSNLSKDATQTTEVPDEQVRRLILKGLVYNPSNSSGFITAISYIKYEYGKVAESDRSKQTEDYLRKILIKHLTVRVEGEDSIKTKELLLSNTSLQTCKTFDSLLIELATEVRTITHAITLSNKYTKNDSRKKNGGDKVVPTPKPSIGGKVTTPASNTACYYCGNAHSGECKLKEAAHSNKEDKPWHESKQGKYYANLGWTNCPRQPQTTPKPTYPQHTGTNKGWNNKQKGESLLTLNESENKHSINMTLLLPQGKQESIQVLLDTGAVTRDYISSRVASMLEANGIVRLASTAVICSGFTDKCEQCSGKVAIEIISKDESDQFIKLNLTATIIQTPFDLIIGRPSIKKYQLAKRFPSQFFDNEDMEEKTLGLVEDKPEKTFLINARKDIVRASSIRDKIHRLTSLNESSNSFKSNAAHSSAFERDDIEEIPLDRLEAVPSELIEEGEEDVQLPTRIYGPESLQIRLRQILEQHRDCFSTSLKSEPAKVPPYELRVNEVEWEISKNRLQPRRMDQVRQTEMFRQINVLQSANVLSTSEAPYYCHPLMVPKPLDKWRFCVDFKPINKVSTTEKWPLPNIQEMLRRIGAKKPKYFIILDLTSGYHQIPMAKTSRSKTAFITYWGVFEWLRMPMGLEGAAAYFQKILVTIVLAGLVMIIVELYLDDLIIYAKSEDELIEKFIIVLQRFRKYNITCNPHKSVLGHSEATYVGHTLNEFGMHFKRDKLDSVLNFPTPIFSKQLKSFVCLASYFRDHVRNHATRVHPLFELLKDYDRNSRIVWTEEGEAAFEDIKKAIDECPRIFFMDDVSPIYLFTDASNYGIGAYLYQLIDGKEIPIAFLSRSLDERMRKWSTPEKEGYAIFYALGKWEYLLRNKHFTIKTDHKNLTILKDKYGTQDKVQRWFQCYQGYDINFEEETEYVKGIDNTVADSFSRLCPIQCDNEEDRLCLLEDDELYVPRKQWKIISTVHNSLMGHHGVERTMQKLISLGHKWKDMRLHVRRFKKMCACCQKMENIGPPIKAHKFTVSSNSPMDVIAIDFIEGLIPDEYGNDTIMVVIDTFSRFIELFPMKGNSAKVAAHALIQHIGRYGMPAKITSDRGSAYISKLIKEITDMMGTQLVHTMAYSKQENAIVERANKEIERHIRNIIFDKEVIKKWSKYIPLVQRIINSCEHRITGVTPAEILFGNAVDLDRGIFLEYVPDDTPQKLSHWMADMRKVQAKIINIARGNLTRHAEMHMQTEPINLTEFAINSYVLVEHRHNSLRKGPKSKLLPYRKGPVRVVNAIGSKYTVQDLVTKRNKDYHVKRLVQFNYDPEIHDPLTYALRDETELFAIDRITHIRGNPEGPKANIHFKVHWKNETKTTMEPWRVVRNTAALQTFLADHKKESVRQLIPKNVEIEQDSDTDSDSEIDTGFESP